MPASLKVRALSGLGHDASFDAIYPTGTSQKVAFDSSTQSSAFAANTTLIRVIATQDCHLKFGTSPTALTDGTCVFLKAGLPEYFGVIGLQKVAAIKDSAAGSLFITEGLTA